MEKTKIDWCDSTFNPITGCYHKCSYCYARGITNRFASRRGCRLIEPETYHIHTEDGRDLIEINEQPYYFNDDTEERYMCAYPHGFTPTIHRYRMTEYKDKQRPRNIFVGSMADIFGEWVPDRWIKEVFNACMAGHSIIIYFLQRTHRGILTWRNTRSFRGLITSGLAQPLRIRIRCTHGLRKRNSIGSYQSSLYLKIWEILATV